MTLGNLSVNSGLNIPEDHLVMLNRFVENRDKMLKKFDKKEVENLGKWLEWGRTLFFEGWWTGILVCATKS